VNLRSLALLPWALAGAVQAAAPARHHVDLECEAVYLPARSTWVRQVEIDYDRRKVTAVRIDGVTAYSFSVHGTVILTAVDNERIQIDAAAQSWQSDFRGLAQSQGHCERIP
jgi:hypothetical protein